MRSTLFASTLAASTILASSYFAGNAHAQDASDVSTARQLGIEGMKLAESGQCPQAIEKLARAEKLFHAVTTLERLGECQVQVGKLVEGTENLRKASRETLPANPPPAFVAAQDRAKTALEAATPRLAKLRITVNAPSDAALVVKMDSNVVSNASLGLDRAADPGEHAIEVTAAGYLPGQGHVKLMEGGSDSVTITLSMDPNAVKPSPAATAQSSNPIFEPTRETPKQKNYAGPLIVGGIGLAGIAVGSVFGAIALGGKSDLQTQCRSGVCPTSAHANFDTLSTQATISTIAFIVGGVAVAAAIVWLAIPAGTTTTKGAAHLRPYGFVF